MKTTKYQKTVPASRVIDALRREGIIATRDGAIWKVQRENADATILLPDSLPLESKAVSQLLSFAAVTAGSDSAHASVCKACATPDFHPGSIAPVGTVVATTLDMVIPHSIGTDINCGMRMLKTGLNITTFESHRSKIETALRRCLLENVRNVPLPSAAFKALFEAGPSEFLDSLKREGVWASADTSALQNDISACVGLESFKSSSSYVPEGLWNNDREVIRDPQMGTVGSGNHFVEIQIVDAVLDRHVAYAQGLKVGDVVISIHSGSRDVGFYVGSRWMDRARAAWPSGEKHPNSGLYGLTGPLADEYLYAMGAAARYAWANRVALSELTRQALCDVLGTGHLSLIVDVPHNVVLQEHGMNIHRKGATPAHAGQLGIIPGSMGDYSYLVNGLGNPDWLWSSSHGAGRSVRRQAMRAQKPSMNAERDWHCVTLREERLVEEAPSAYKSIGPVIDAQEDAGLVQAAVRLKPWMTFKA